MVLKTGGKLDMMVSRYEKFWYVSRECTSKEKMDS